MRHRLWSARAAWLAASWLLLVGCSSSEDDDSAGDDDSSMPGDDDGATGTPTSVEARIAVDETVQESATEPGVFTIDYLLFGDSGLTVDVSATWSLDGLSFKPATPASGSEGTSGLSAGPDGVEHAFRWSSIDDLGYADKKVWFRLSGQGGGNELAPQTLQIQVKNTVHDEPCLISASSPGQTDGQIPLEYTVTDAAGDVCQVSIFVTVDAITTPVTQSASGSSDPLTDVVAGATGEPRHFYWDSETDIGPVDKGVVLTFKATDTNNERESEISLTVTNHAVPEQGDLIFSEIMPWPEDGVQWIELYNVTNHALEAASVHFTSEVLNRSTILYQGGSLQVPGKGYVIIAQAIEEANKDWTDHANVEMLMKSNTDTVSIWLDGEPATILDKITYNNDNYADIVDDVDGYGLGLKPELLGTGGQDTVTGWCLQDTALPGYTSDYGSPHGPTVCLTAPSTQ